MENIFSMSWGKFIRADITPQSKIVYLYLEEFMARHKRVYCRQATMAKDLGLSKRTIVRCIKELSAHNYISRKRLRSSCDYSVHLGLLHKETSDLATISRPSNLYNKSNTYKTTKKRTNLSYLTQHLGKNLKANYKTKVKEINAGTQLKKAEQDKVNKFFSGMDKEVKAEFWNNLLNGTLEWPSDLPQLGKVKA